MLHVIAPAFTHDRWHLRQRDGISLGVTGIEKLTFTSGDDSLQLNGVVSFLKNAKYISFSIIKHILYVPKAGSIVGILHIKKTDNQDGGARTERRQPRWRRTEHEKTAKIAAHELNADNKDGDPQTKYKPTR